jgi:hypothetical protein
MFDAQLFRCEFVLQIDDVAVVAVGKVRFQTAAWLARLAVPDAVGSNQTTDTDFCQSVV